MKFARLLACSKGLFGCAILFASLVAVPAQADTNPGGPADSEVRAEMRGLEREIREHAETVLRKRRQIADIRFSSDTRYKGECDQRCQPAAGACSDAIFMAAGLQSPNLAGSGGGPVPMPVIVLPGADVGDRMPVYPGGDHPDRMPVLTPTPEPLSCVRAFETAGGNSGLKRLPLSCRQAIQGCGEVARRSEIERLQADIAAAETEIARLQRERLDLANSISELLGPTAAQRGPDGTQLAAVTDGRREPSRGPALDPDAPKPVPVPRRTVVSAAGN